MIIGITGTLGAGKGTVADYLTKKHGFVYFSVRNFIAQEVLHRGLMVNRDTLTSTGNALRAEHGPSYITEQLMGQALNVKNGNVVIESIRSIGEANYLKTHGAVIWAVDADIQTRYHRVVKRTSETDSVTFEKFTADEQREMKSDDPNNQNLAAVRDMANLVLRNDGTQDELFQQVETALQKVPK